MEWQGEANSASITVRGGSRLHLRLPGNYRLDNQWQGADNATLHLTFTTRPHPPPPAASTRSKKDEERADKSSQILVCVLICVFLCLLLLLSLSITGFLPARSFSPRRPASTRESGFTKEQLREAGTLGP